MPASPQPLWRQMTWWTLALPAVMLFAVAQHDIRLLNWIHVLSGALWTGADLFMGVILGPVFRRLEISARTAVVGYLVPRTLLYFPMVSLTAATAGWYLASWLGFSNPDHPLHFEIIVALALVTVMAVVGLGFLLPNSLRIWFELHRTEPDRERIVRLNRINVWLAGSQGLMQVAMLMVMARLVI